MGKNVIGGEFAIWPELFQGDGQNHKLVDSVAYSSGRHALYAILKEIERAKSFGRRVILLPDYLCDSITKTVLDAGWEYEFYSVTEGFGIDECSLCKGLESGAGAVLLINYFGMADQGFWCRKIKETNPDIGVILDHVQAYYEPWTQEADYLFTSLRKWFPCPDGAMVIKQGGVLSVDAIEETNEFAKYKFAGNLLKTVENQDDETEMLSLLEKGELCLDEHYLCPASEMTKGIFANLHLEQMASIRRENARILHEELEKLCIPHLYKENAVPLFLPIVVDKRDQLRKSFFERNIFTPKHWPRVSIELNGENVLYEKELSLICDHRYGKEDMLSQIEVIREFYA